MSRFIPNSNARHRLLADLVDSTLDQAGDLLTYEQLFPLLNLTDDFEGRTSLAGTVTKANKVLADRGSWKHLQCDDKVGYRLASPGTSREEFFGRLKHVRREIGKAIQVSDKVQRHPDSDQQTIQRATDASASMAAQQAAFRKEEARLKKGWVLTEESPVQPDAVTM